MAEKSAKQVQRPGFESPYWIFYQIDLTHSVKVIGDFNTAVRHCKLQSFISTVCEWQKRDLTDPVIATVAFETGWLKSSRMTIEPGFEGVTVTSQS